VWVGGATAASAAVGWDDRYLLRREREFHARQLALKQRVGPVVFIYR
jgi:hypothetical protein